MSVLSWLRGEERAVDASTFPRGDALFGNRTDAGVTVNHETALNLISVYACITLISDAISSLPVDVYRNVAGTREQVTREPAWLTRPNPDMSWREGIDRVLHSLLVAGNAFLLITARNDLGFPIEFFVIHPDEIRVTRRDGVKEFQWIPGGQTFSHYTPVRPNGQMVHIMGHSADGLVGLSPIDKARQSIGLGLASDKYGAQFFGAGAQVSGVLELPAGSNPTTDQINKLAADFRRKYSGVENAWKPIVLGNGAQWKPITVPNDQAQFLESRKFTIEEIARLYRVPPHRIGHVDGSTSWGSGIEQQNIVFVQDTLTPWITRLEDSFSQMTPRGQYVKWNVNGLLRGDTQARYASYQTGIASGFLSRNEVRELEDRPPAEGLDEFLVPVNVAQPQGASDAT